MGKNNCLELRCGHRFSHAGTCACAQTGGTDLFWRVKVRV